jgi:hypothetical protein
MTAAKFKPLIFSVLGFAFSFIADIYTFMVLYEVRPLQVQVQVILLCTTQE